MRPGWNSIIVDLLLKLGRKFREERELEKWSLQDLSGRIPPEGACDGLGIVHCVSGSVRWRHDAVDEAFCDGSEEVCECLEGIKRLNDLGERILKQLPLDQLRTRRRKVL